jgi:hypothetical protein
MKNLLLLCFILVLHYAHTFVTYRRRHQMCNGAGSRLWAGADDYLKNVRDRMLEAGFEKMWKESAITLSNTAKLDIREAEECLAQAWEWKNWAICSSPIARRYIRTIEPDAFAVAASLHWLQTGPLSLDLDILRAAILGSPKVYLCSPEKNYLQALRVAPKRWQDPANFKRLLVSEDPTLLMRTFNCVDDGCNSECGNCWVSKYGR